MNRSLGAVSSVWNHICKRSVHFKHNAGSYPKVNINDVELDKPRYGFRKERDPLLSQTITDTLFPSKDIKKAYLKAGKPVPIKYRSNSDDIARRNFERYQEEVAEGKPHFKVGEKKVYLPKARVCLLRPNAKHTPYQAKFLVPRNFNKMDLRDYLWHVYGLRALNITVQLLHAKLNRTGEDYARYRGPQYKKMTIDMEEPFVWPDLPQGMAEKLQAQKEEQIKTITHKNALGSDKLKKPDAFDGLYKKPDLPNTFVPARAQKIGASKVHRHKEHTESKADKQLLTGFLGL